MMFSSLVRPLDAVCSLRGLTIIDECKVLRALVVGYFAIVISKVLKLARASIEKRFGATRIEFVAKLTDLKFILYRSSDGFYFVIRCDKADYWIAQLIWEPEVMQVFKPKQGEVITDIGAHIGTYTIRAAKAVGKEGLVIALEPQPESFRLLNINVKSNELSNVIALRMAAYENDGTAIMHVSKDSSGNSLTRVPEEFTGEIEVPTITLNTIVKRFCLKRVDWVKIDVEGAELAVLKGASNVLGIIRKLLIEVWYENADEVLDILRQRGYKISVLSRGKLNMCVMVER